MNRNTILPVLFRIAAVLWMAMIFFFSSQSASESSQTSSPFVRMFLSLFHAEYESLSPEEQFELGENVSFMVRKTAHFSIYTILGVLLYAAVSTTQPGPKLKAPLSFLIGALYAVSDEIHQSFVPGRSCELRDMTIDSVGVLLGVLICAGIASLIRMRKEKRDRLSADG